MTHGRLSLVAALIGALGLSSGMARAAPPAPRSPPVGARPADIDRLASRIMERFHVPGMAVAVVRGDEPALVRSYGVRQLGKPAPVDAATLFGIGSNTKAFTTAALAILVDEGKLSWDDKVIDRLPGFRLADPYVTRELTVRDLLTHRSGLGMGSGDLMLFPASDFTRAEIIHNLRYLAPASSFRSKFAYDNLLYIVAGELIPAVTGDSWEHFVQTRILDRMGGGCVATLAMAGANRDIAVPHVIIDGKLTSVAPDPSTAYDPAGSIQCSAEGMAAWARLQLSGGVLPDGSRLFSEARHAEMWAPQIVISPLPDTAAMTRTHFRDYGLGWFVEDYDGAMRVGHTGGLIGMVSYVSLLPEQKTAVIVLTNQQSGPAMAAMMQSLLDPLIGRPSQDWVGYWSAKDTDGAAKAAEADTAANAAIAAAGGRAALPLDAYVGVYRDVWRGDATVSRSGSGLRLTFSRTAGMSGELKPMTGNVFAVRWDDRSLKADALVNFRTGMDGKVSGITMAPLSPTTDFSFDFKDLDFTRAPEASAR